VEFSVTWELFSLSIPLLKIPPPQHPRRAAARLAIVMAGVSCHDRSVKQGSGSQFMRDMVADQDQDDHELATRAGAGDQEALTALLTRYRSLIFTTCIRLTGNWADAEDATQNTMIAVFRAIGRFRHESKVSTWIYRIAVREALNVGKGKASASLSDAVDHQAGEHPAIDGQVIDRLDINKALERLDPQFRAVIYLSELGFSYDEVSQILGIPEATARTRRFRGLRALAALLSQCGG
jgi:RNA polymerase sigma-70 factor (ECF subfamily)